MNNLYHQPIKQIFLIFLLLVFITISTLSAEEVKNTATESDQSPSLDLLLYLGEFQDRDGSLLEPEQFDKSLQLEKQKQSKKDEKDENINSKITATKKEDDCEKSQP